MGRVSRILFRFIRGSVKLVYPRPTLEGTENLPEGACVIVGNHAQIHGPIIAEIYVPGPHYTWCAGEMMHLREVPGYAYRDFWSQKPKSVRWLFWIASRLIAPLSVCVFGNASCIGVYRDRRIHTTFRETLVRLEEGNRIVIFPEEDAPCNHILSRFQNGFVNVARMHHRRTGQALQFVPMYTAPRLRKVVFGRPVAYDPSRPIEEERERITSAMVEAITGLAMSLPEHTVVPYRNIPKRDYPRSRPKEEARA